MTGATHWQKNIVETMAKGKAFKRDKKTQAGLIPFNRLRFLTCPLQCIFYAFRGCCYCTALIGVFQSKDKAASVFSGKEIVVQSSPEPSQM